LELLDFFGLAVDAGEEFVGCFVVITKINSPKQVLVNKSFHTPSLLFRGAFPTAINGSYSAAVDKTAACTCSKLGSLFAAMSNAI
jgi:hypothetical protein